MAGKRLTSEEIVARLRQVDVQNSQGKTVAEAVLAIGVTAVTYYRWRKKYGRLKGDQVKRLKELEAENARLRRAVSDLTLDKMILAEAGGNYYAPRVGGPALIMLLPNWAFQSDGRAGFWGNIDRRSARSPEHLMTRQS